MIVPTRCYSCRKVRKLKCHPFIDNMVFKPYSMTETWLCRKCEKEYENYLKKKREESHEKP